MGDVADFLSNDGLGEHLGGGAPGDVEVADGLAIAVEFVSFGDVAGDTDSRSSELITQAKVVFKGTARAPVQYLVRSG